MLAREHAGCPRETYPPWRLIRTLESGRAFDFLRKGFWSHVVTTISRAAICARMSGLLSTPETAALTRSTISEDILAGPASVSREVASTRP